MNMIETEDKAIYELKKKGCHIQNGDGLKVIRVPKDHGCGNKSFARLDNLQKMKWSVLFVEQTEKDLQRQYGREQRNNEKKVS